MRETSFNPAHPYWDIALAVQDAPDIDMIILFDIEYEIGKAFERPAAKAL